MSAPDLEALLAQGNTPQSHGGSRPTYTPDVARARADEIRRRWTVARNMAQTALRRLHYDDYRSLTEQARAKVSDECGALPGDDGDDSSDCAHPSDAVYWNEFSQRTQCHRCGHIPPLLTEAS